MVVERWIECRGDLWKDGARSLQLRLRDRFRVAVGRHRRRNFHNLRLSTSDYFAATVRRWLDRFHDFRDRSLPCSSTFYRKRVSKEIDAETDSVLTRMLQAVAVPVIGNVCHVFMHGLNQVQIYGAENLHQAVLNRPENKPLITVSNHVAAMDDPLVIAALLPPSILVNAHSLRWTLCASDRCFTNPVTSAFFKYVKVLPVSRGDGIYQEGMDLAISKLNRGGWVHIFPEGSRSRNGGRTIGSVKRGIGRLVSDADNLPIVVPFVHTGMQEVMPVGSKFPKVGKTVTVIIGDPINFDDLLNNQENQNVSRGKLYDAVSARIGDRLQKLKLQLDRLLVEQASQLQEHAVAVAERAARYLHQVDWESLGMENHLSIQCSSPTKQSPHVGPEVAQVYQQESDSEGQQFRVGFANGGMVSRMRGCMDLTESVGFAARGLFINLRNENSECIRGNRALRAWNNFWRTMSEEFPRNSLFASPS